MKLKMTVNRRHLGKLMGKLVFDLKWNKNANVAYF